MADPPERLPWIADPYVTASAGLHGRLIGLVAQQAPAPPLAFPIYAYVTHEEVFGYRLPAHHVFEGFGQLPRGPVLHLLSKVATVLANDGTVAEDIQARLCADLFSPPITRRIGEIVGSGDGRMVFGEQQLLTAMKLIVMEGRTDSGTDLRSPQVRQKLMQLLLAVNDLMHEDLGERVGASGEHVTEEMFIQDTLRQVALQRPIDPVTMFPVYHHLLVELAGGPTGRGLPAFVDVDDEFRRTVGMDLETWFHLGLGIALPQLFTSLLRGNLEAGSCALDRRTCFAEVPDEELRRHGGRLLDMVSATPGTLAHYFRRAPADPAWFYYDVLPFAARPLIRVSSQSLLCTSPRLLVNKIVPDLYWVLFFGMKARGAENEARRLSSYVGHLYEEHVAQVLESLAPRMAGGTRRLYRELRYGRGGGKAGPDAALFYPRSAVFFEVHTLKLRYEQVALRADIEDVAENYKDAIVEKAKQLDRCISDFREGKLEYDGWPPEEIGAFCPVLVCLHDFVLHRPLWERVVAWLADEAILQEPDTLPLRVLCGDELYMVCALVESGESLWDILRTWARHDTHSEVSFANYASASGLSPPRCSWVMNKWSEFTRGAQDHIFPGGVHTRQTGGVADACKTQRR